MKLELPASVGMGIGVALVVVIAGVLLARRFAPQLAAAVNPLDAGNVFNQGAGAVVAQVSGGAAAGGEDSVGGVFARFREWVSGDDARIREMLKGAPPATKYLGADPVAPTPFD